MIIERQGAIYILLCKLWNIIHHSTSCLRREQSIACFRQSGNHRNALAIKVGNGWKWRWSDPVGLQVSRTSISGYGYGFWRFQCYTSVCRMALTITSLWLGLTELVHSTPLGCLTRAPSERCVPGSKLQIFPNIAIRFVIIRSMFFNIHNCTCFKHLKFRLQ